VTLPQKFGRSSLYSQVNIQYPQTTLFIDHLNHLTQAASFRKNNGMIFYMQGTTWLHCFDALGWAAGRASGL